MSQTLVKNYLHIVFSTKRRKNFITPEIENELYSYMGGICKSMNCQPITIGGHLNHVHILCMLSRNVTLADLLEEVKTHSSKWIKTKDISFRNFYWQIGYGAFSVNPYETKYVEKYIKTQHKHHSKINYEDELIYFLKKYQIEYDEKYLWD